MDKLTEKVASSNTGYRINNEAISLLCYADDTAIFAQTKDHLQKQLFEFYHVGQSLNINISIEKKHLDASS